MGVAMDGLWFCLFLSVLLLKYGSKGDSNIVTEAGPTTPLSNTGSFRDGDVLQSVDLIEAYGRLGALEIRDGANFTLPLRSVLPAGLPSTFTISATFRTNNSQTWSLIELRSSSLLFSIKLIPNVRKMEVFLQRSRVLFSTPSLFRPFWHKIHVTITNDTVHAAIDCEELVPERIREWDLSNATSVTIVSNDYGTPAPVDLQWLSLSCNRFNLTKDSCEEIGSRVPRALPGSPPYSRSRRSTTSDSLLAFSGPKGQKGEKGDQGYYGLPGHTGIKGSRGVPGPIGPPGTLASSNLIDQPNSISEDDVRNICEDLIRERLEDLSSSQSASGSPGLIGPPGPPGPKGFKGEMGDEGMPGYPGEMGDFGRPGLDGKPGLPGIKGEPGSPGRPACKGEQGPEGPSIVEEPSGLPSSPPSSRSSTSTTSDSLLAFSGPKGEKGEQGDLGPPGLQGIKGSRGDPGPIGRPGILASSNLIDQPNSISEDDVRNICEDLIRERLEETPRLRGLPGPIGPRGEEGLKGDPGFVGLPGEKGYIGLDGLSGKPGLPGIKGEPGSPGMCN